MTQNPFTPMLLTFNPDYFYGRGSEIISILQVITNPEPNGHALYGLRTIGKTTLLKFLKDKNGALLHYEDYMRDEFRHSGWRRLLFVYMSFHDFTEQDNLFFIILSQLEDDIDNDEELADRVYINEFDEHSPRAALVKILRKALEDLDRFHIRAVFLMDDFDNALRFVESDDDHLLRNLCELAVLIIVTEDPISSLRPDIGASSPLLGILRPESIGLLTDNDAKHLISDPLRKSGILFSAEEEDFLIDVAGRQPFLLTATCELYFNNYVQYPEIHTWLDTPEGKNKLEKQLVIRLSSRPHIKDVLTRTWAALDETEQQTLHHMAAGNKINYLDECAHIAESLENKALAYWDMKHNTYKVFSRIFADFIRRYYQTAEDGLTLINVIHQLSPIDQALARYLYQRPNQICTFDELLDAIWSDSEKSKRALEAAVHRIRQHLSPHEEIKNIRGKGYTFVTKAMA